MYSLYRAWLSLTPGGILPPGISDPLTPGFSGSAYCPQTSGTPDVTLQVGPGMTQFLAHKNILSAHSGFFKAVFLNSPSSGPHINTPIMVPNVNIEEFSSLLTFMYTGFLDLNFANIYNILLATHILHMPRALEICRSFLIQHHPLEPPHLSGSATNIVKPIPSRKAPIPQQQPQIFPPLFGNLQKSDDTPFRTIVAAPSSSEKPEQQQPAKSKEDAPHKRSNISGKSKKRSEDQQTNVATEKSKVIIDVACCDGPVRFHRVLNKNYGLKPSNENSARGSATEQTAMDRSIILNKIMGDSIRGDREAENAFARQRVHQQEAHPDGDNANLFTCVYCNHTFKSQYCYQKHARRHLNPVCMDASKPKPSTETVPNKREVKLLDMNVQYYPCKTCGSKFPSYYFVHKHRKMCHAEEIAEENGQIPSCTNNCGDEINSKESEQSNSNNTTEIEVGEEN